MANKVQGATGAVGYWGRDPYKRVESEQIPQKIRALLQDKLLTRGKDAFLWVTVNDGTPNSLVCSCVKDTSEKPDVTCNSCYGTQFIPGYVKVLHNTLFLSSISLGASLTNVQLDIAIKPHRIVLQDMQLSGSITSCRLQYSNLLGLDWDFKLDAPNIIETNLVQASFSTDGIQFFPLEEINDNGKKPVGIGGIYLRVSLSRASVSDRSPEFQIVRVRYPNRSKPYIKILRPQRSDLPSLMQYGRRNEALGERFWTMPLDFFDSNIPKNTPLAKIQENAFYTRVDGIHAGDLYVTTKLMYDEEFGIFTWQSFEGRRTQPEEVYSKLVF